jgi:DNA topoisomerase IB
LPQSQNRILSVGRKRGEKVSARLGNTPTICRNCYVHPEVLNYYMDVNLLLELESKAENELRSGIESLKPEEAAILALLRGRLAKEARFRESSGRRLIVEPRQSYRPSRKSSRCP